LQSFCGDLVSHTESQTRIRPGNEQSTGTRRYAGLLRPFLNHDILKLTIKAPSQISKLLQIEMTHCNEMNDKIFDKIFDIDIDVDIDINV
jgi:hypothetical protein